MRALLSIICALLLTVTSAECFRVLQAASYRPQRGYVKILFSWYFLSLLFGQLIALLIFHISEFITVGIYAALAIAWSVVKRKCPLKFTKRIIRMLAVEYVCIFTLCYFVGVSFWACVLPLLALLAWLICLPVDVMIAKYYLKKATEKLRQSGVTVIAVTGSYGKTSVKDMLSVLIDNSIAPSGSCNTPLGISTYINNTDLNGRQYLILEFGARKIGDIKELCRLFKPLYGVLTGVCAQHLSTFGSIDNVLQAKCELPKCLPQDGFCVVNSSDEFAEKILEVGDCAKHLSYENLQIETLGVDFDGTKLRVTVDGETREMCLPQISDYVKDTFAMCLQMALKLGQTLDQTLARVGDVKQTPHRMELMKGANCYILDDSYNGSIVGVKSCCATLKNFHCVKVAITQGLVECGRNSHKLNVECGKFLGSVCDVAVVLGVNASSLAEGLNKTDCKVVFAQNLTQAVALANKYVNGGIILFQNDLPDVVNL
ncbi:MAG: hypothetical protein J1F66_01615 [Clostridiales bacterium]|nr:hypothetical protein [Clostridiales bacterium]